MALHILLDGLPLSPRYSGCGVNRYLVNLLRATLQNPMLVEGMHFRVLVPSAKDAVVLGPEADEKMNFVPCLPMRMRQIWKLGMFLPPTIGNNEVLFLTQPNVLLRKRSRVAVIVYDIIPLRMPPTSGLARGWLSRRACLGSLRKADLLLTVSYHSKAELVSFGGVSPERVVVTYSGYDPALFNTSRVEPAEEQAVLKKYGIIPPYLLSVGMIEPRKNLERLVAAYRLLRNRFKEDCPQLVLCGQLLWGYEDLLRLVHEPDLVNRVILTGRVSDMELAFLYKASFAYVFPSLYEGFGLPLIEAMASGVPVASSSSTCLPEVAGDAALYFNPQSSEEMAAAIERLLRDSALRENLIERGFERVKLYTWAECARRTVEALRQL